MNGCPGFWVAAKADFPFKGFRDIVDDARQNPKKLTVKR